MKHNEKYILAFIIVVAILFRIVLLNSVPGAVNHDQLYYLLNAKSFALTGQDLSQTISLKDVLLFSHPGGESPQSELPFFLSMTTLGVFPFSLFAAFLPNIVLSILTVLLLYLIARKLFNEQVALVTGFVAAVNPWLVFSGRTFYEVVPVTFFYLLGFYILLIAKDWKILLAFPAFLLAFYSYIGTKVIFLPLILFFILYCYFFVNKKKFLKYYIILGALCLGVVLFFLLQLKSAGGASRLSEVVLPTHPAIASKVDELRRLTIDFPPLSLYVNKLTVYASIITTLFFEAVSPVYLFLKGDYFFALGNHGFFYLIDAVLLIVGAVAIFKAKKAAFFLIFLVILLSFIPQLIHDPTGTGSNFAPHLVILFPFVILLIGYGAWQLFSTAPKKYAKLVGVLLIGVYVISVGNFKMQYFYQLPLKKGLFDLPSRQLSYYISKVPTTQNVIIYSSSPRDIYKAYLFYANALNKETAQDVQESFKENDYTLRNVSVRSCNTFSITSSQTDVVIIEDGCKKSFNKDFIALPFLSDSGSIYKLYNDPVCREHNLNRYIDGVTFKDLNIEKLVPKEFCERLMITGK